MLTKFCQVDMILFSYFFEVNKYDFFKDKLLETFKNCNFKIPVNIKFWKDHYFQLFDTYAA